MDMVRITLPHAQIIAEKVQVWKELGLNFFHLLESKIGFTDMSQSPSLLRGYYEDKIAQQSYRKSAFRYSKTMRSSQVYQPTTTTINYDRHKAWVPSFLANSSSSSTWSRTVMLSLSVLFAIMGLVMIIVGATSYNAIEEGSFTEDNATAYIIILCVGILLEIAAITALIMYYRTLGYYIPCCPGKIARIRKRLHENQMVVNGQVVNVGEPVSAQYCPPAQPVVGSTPPPPYTDISEEQRLMDEKPDIGLPMGGVCDVKPYHHHHYSPLMCLVFRSDDTERILEEDPRIVLTPLKSQEEC